MVELKKGHCKLLIEEPQEGYKGARFDWTGKLVQFWWKGIPFCTTEKSNGSSKKQGRGFFNEFGITDPVGYEVCEVGGHFPKIGVGLLQKVNREAYDFFFSYTILPFEFCEVRGTDFIELSCLNKQFDSAFFLQKKITLTDTGFTIDYLFENIGNFPIVTSEYVHNFLSLGGKGVGSQVNLLFDDEINIPQFEKGLNPGCVQFKKNSIHWDSIPKHDFFFENITRVKHGKTAWVLTNTDVQLGICEIVNFKPEKINLWGRNHVVSPEVFKSINLLPGESDKWQREYKIIELK